MPAARHRRPAANVVEALGPLARGRSLWHEVVVEDGHRCRHLHEVVGPERVGVPPVVEVVADRGRDRLRDPVQRYEREQGVARETALRSAAGVGPGAPLLQDPGRETRRGIVEPVSDRLRLRRLDRAVPALDVRPALVFGESRRYNSAAVRVAGACRSSFSRPNFNGSRARRLRHSAR